MDIKTLSDTPPWEWPESAGKTILKVLIDSRAKASDRLIAAELAGDLTVMNDDLAGVLLGIARNGDERAPLRSQAAISLGPILEYAFTEGFGEPDPEFDLALDPDDVPITEQMFHNLQQSLHELYKDESVPKEVRRRVLEASVRSPQDWLQSAVREAYSSGDRDWELTAVFAMRHVRGFEDAILDSLQNPDPDIQAEAVRAAGNWELQAAWDHVAALVTDPATPKPLLLAAIEAVPGIRPQEAGVLLVDLADSDDEEIAEAADEALSEAESLSAEDEYDEEDEEGEEDDDEEEEEERGS
jgi:hypothetical protein